VKVARGAIFDLQQASMIVGGISNRCAVVICAEAAQVLKGAPAQWMGGQQQIVRQKWQRLL
jgi:hypothetical protein